MTKAICGAKTKKGTPCQLSAGWGTPHVGSGRCKLHGGLSTGPRNGPGTYRTRIDSTYQEIYDAFRNSDDLKSLNDEIALVKTLIVEKLDQDKRDPADVVKLVERLSRITKRKVEIEEGLRVYVHLDQLTLVINQVVQVVERHVPDHETRAAIGRDLRGINLGTDR